MATSPDQVPPQELSSVEEIVRRYLDWLDSEISIEWVNHNHKEKMAFSATAIYLGVLGLAFSAAPFLSNWFWKLLFCVFLGALAYVTYVFVNMQLQMRWNAADRSRGLRRAKTRLCSITTYEEIAMLDQSLREVERMPGVKADEYPAFIMEQIEYAKTLPQTLREVTRLLHPSTLEQINARTRSELAQYSILTVVTVISIFMVLAR